MDSPLQPYVQLKHLDQAYQPTLDARKTNKWTTPLPIPEWLNKFGRVCFYLAIILATILMTLAVIPLRDRGPYESKSAEAYAELGTLKDRLREKYIQNGNKVDPNWTLASLLNVQELNGKYYGAGDYSLSGLTARSAILTAAANAITSAPQVTMTITNIASGTGTISSP